MLTKPAGGTFMSKPVGIGLADRFNTLFSRRMQPGFAMSDCRSVIPPCAPCAVNFALPEPPISCLQLPWNTARRRRRGITGNHREGGGHLYTIR
jgi:hypothetical protein